MRTPIWLRHSSLTCVAILALLAAASQPCYGGDGKSGLHLPHTRTTGFNWVRSDGGGFNWDIQYYGTVGQGTNYAYSGGLYCQVDGSNVYDDNRQAWVSEGGDEIEIGPTRRNALNISRRVKVYKDAPLARWMDIYENTTGNPINVMVQVYSNVNYGIGGTKTSSGGASFGEADWAFITSTRGGAAIPSLLHAVCGPKSKVRPQQVQISSSTIMVRWSLAVPANKTVILCYFESQNPSMEALQKLMGQFRINDVLKDLPGAVRSMIVNFQASSSFGDIEIERSEKSDTILITNGDPMYGRIADESFTLGTLYGDIKLPAEKVIGMVPLADEPGRVRVLMADGQILSGVSAGTEIKLELPSGGGTLNVPLRRISQWSYQVSKQRPFDIALAMPVAILRTGDRLTFDATVGGFTFRTRHGVVPLVAKDLLEITLDNAPNAVHRASFLNGSRLGGFLEPEKPDFQLKIGPKLSVRRDMIARIVFAEEAKPNPILTQIVLSNEDELFGELADESLDVDTDYGAVKVKPGNIRALAFSPAQMGRVWMQLWDGNVLRGLLRQEELAFSIAPGVKMNLHVGQVRKVIRNQALPPEDLIKRIDQLVAQLGAESYKDRQAASDALAKMGSGILALLRGRLETDDPEVRQRLEDIIERLESESGGRDRLPDSPPEPFGVQIRLRG